MTITFNAATAAATFDDLFTDSEADNTWYRLWTGNATGTDGDWVDTSSFNDYGNGWIEKEDDLALLDPDYAQGTAEQDTHLWVQTWNVTDGASSWEHGAVEFSDITDVQQTSEVQGDTTFDEMFTDLDISTKGTTWYQFWVGDASGADGEWASTTYGNGWVELSNLSTETFTAPAEGESTELWMRSYNSSTKEYSGWEHWTVTADVTVVVDAAGTTTADDAVAETFDITIGDYAHTIDNFDPANDLLDFLDFGGDSLDLTAADLSLVNTADDGEAVLSYTPDAGATVAEITLMGLSSSEDLALTSAAGVNDILA